MKKDLPVKGYANGDGCIDVAGVTEVVNIIQNPRHSHR